MSEVLIDNLLRVAALCSAVAGMGWLAVSMDVHAVQVWGRVLPAASVRLMRGIGATGLGVALLLCLSVDHASMAVLVWIMALSGAALLVAFCLSSHPRWLAVLAPWVRRG